MQCCGDAHLLNFGAYGTPERNLVFDVNDFDETHPGPFEWDVLRLATSFVSCGAVGSHSALLMRKPPDPRSPPRSRSVTKPMTAPPMPR